MRCFEAAFRHESFKAAAEELGVTPGAVSQQIRALEDQLGRKLFERRPRQVRLTAAGRRLGGAACRAFADLAAAAREVRAVAAAAPLTVEVGPFFSAKWLSLRLPGFLRDNPGIELALHHRVAGRLPDSAVDLAVLWGEGDWPEMAVRPIARLAAQPIAAPDLAAGDWLAAGTLLHYRDRKDWGEWLRATGQPAERAQGGVVYDEPNVLVAAARAGQGIAVGYRPLVDDELAQGHLARADPRRVPLSRAYHLVFAPDALAKPAARRFHDWILAQTDS